MRYVIAIPYIVAVITWLVAVISWIRSLQHLAEGVTVSTMLFNGVKSFDSDNFTPEGQKHQKRFLKAAGGFLICIFLGMVATVALSA